MYTNGSDFFIVSSPLEGMDDLSASEIETVIGKLLGSYVPICETNTDNKRFERQQVAETVIWDMAEMMIEVAAYYNRPEYSANRAGKKALTFLAQEAERITEVLEDLLKEE